MKSFIHKKTPQAELKIHVHYPKGWTRADKRPAAVFFFGGGWTSGTVKHFVPQATYFAARGLVTARADYRVKSRHGVTPDQCVEDAKSAVRWVRANAATLGVDPDRIVGSGGSAGAHIAACAAMTRGLEAKGEDTSISSRPNLLVLFNPPLRLHGRARAARHMAHDPEMGKRISPVGLVRKSTPPALLLYGANDRFYREDAREFAAAAGKVGAEVKLLAWPRVGHGFFNREPYLSKTLRAADEFLVAHGYLTGKPTSRPARRKK